MQPRAMLERVTRPCAEVHEPRHAIAVVFHDMGRALDDGVTQGQASGHDWRTTPLWGLRERSRFLHDGRARTVEAAILAHGGEADRLQP